jgi:hypothetical protein
MNSQISFTNKYFKSLSDKINYLTYKDVNKFDCYVILFSDAAKINKLMKVKDGTFNVSDYGKILFSGYGKVPDIEVIKNLKEKYDIDFPIPNSN